VRESQKKGRARRRKNKKLPRLLQAVLPRPIFRRIPDIRLSVESTKEDVLNRAARSNRFFGWIKGRAQSFAHAGRGFYLLCLTQWNFRIHLITGLGAICLACYFRLSAVEWLVLIAAIALVLTAEALNTALERMVDLLEPERHPVARDAKDLAAAGVLMASLLALIVGVILFGPRVLGLFR
jgi:diacylglycerol kinase